ncbi:MAG TPA: PilZ domain-containing protein [Pirellulales bacterium]|nr:PilZ domain-containing protein [Pirellulales bacterium]
MTKEDTADLATGATAMPAKLEQDTESPESLAETVNRAEDGSEPGGSETNGNRERRRSKRFAFPTIQLMAEYDHNGLPSRDQFRQVQCQDVSSGGISFLWPRFPDFEYIVIALETNGPPIHVTARVTSVRPAPSQTGQLLIGCQFTGRLNTY